MSRLEYEKNKTYWLRRAGLLSEEPAPEPVVADVPVQAREIERPRCVRCGGQPNLGRCGPEGGVKSYCHKCADEEYLESLSPEERSLLRR